MIGYLIDLALANELPDRDIAPLLTQVEADPADPAFAAPSKPIGPGLFRCRSAASGGRDVMANDLRRRGMAARGALTGATPDTGDQHDQAASQCRRDRRLRRRMRHSGHPLRCG